MLRTLTLGLILILAGLTTDTQAQTSMEDDPIIAVYRWYNKADGDHILVGDGELSDGTLI